MFHMMNTNKKVMQYKNYGCVTLRSELKATVLMLTEKS